MSHAPGTDPFTEARYKFPAQQLSDDGKAREVAKLDAFVAEFKKIHYDWWQSSEFASARREDPEEALEMLKRKYSSFASTYYSWFCQVLRHETINQFALDLFYQKQLERISMGGTKRAFLDASRGFVEGITRKYVLNDHMARNTTAPETTTSDDDHKANPNPPEQNT